jgi:diguanylate cyclase (GGDEF)-like protein
MKWWFSRPKRASTTPPLGTPALGRGDGPIDKDERIRMLEAQLTMSRKEQSRMALELADGDKKVHDLQRELRAYHQEHSGSPLMTLLCKAFDRLQAAVMIAYTDGRLVYGNAEAESLFGPIAGRQAHHMFLDELRAPFKHRLEDTQVGPRPKRPGHELWDATVAPDGGFVHDRVEIRSSEGEVLDMALTMQRLEDQSGHPCFVLIEALDIGALSKDELTKLFRREVGIRVLTREIEFRERSRERNPRVTMEPLSVVFIDLDDFKGINTRYTDAGGDEVLRKVGKVLQRGTRAGSKDVVCRWYSGDEFLPVIFAEHDVAVQVAQRLDREIKELEVPFDGEIIRVSASIGVATYRPGETWEELVERAAEGKSESKSSGKGRVTTEMAPLKRDVIPFRPSGSGR